MSLYLRNKTVPAAKVHVYPKRTRLTGSADDLRLRASVVDALSMTPHPEAEVTREICYGDFFRVPVEMAS